LSPKVSESYKKEKVWFILDSASRVFIAKGFDETTMQDIVDACGFSRGNLYRYFSSTEEIFKAILESELSQSEDVFSDMIHSGVNALDIIKVFLEEEKSVILNIQNTMIPAAYEFFIKNRRKKKESGYLAKRHKDAVNALTKVIEYGIERGEFAKGHNPSDLSNYIVNSLEGLLIAAASIGIDEPSVSRQMQIFNEFIALYLKRGL
jgi:AcrR family transcriptional regulator